MTTEPTPEATKPKMTIDELVPVRTVVRNGSQIIGSIAVMSLVMRFTEGEIVIDPVLSVMLLIASIGFYLMSRCK